MMYWIIAVLCALALAHLVAAITATVVVLRDGTLSRFQLFGQLAISWLGIYAGPLFILYLINDHSPELVPSYAQEGFLHWVLFAPIKPAPHPYASSHLGDNTGAWAAHHGIGGADSCGHDGR